MRERNEEARLVVSDFLEVYPLPGAWGGPAIPPPDSGSTSGGPPHVVYLEPRGFLGYQGPNFVSRCLACLRSETEGRFEFDGWFPRHRGGSVGSFGLHPGTRRIVEGGGDGK